MPRRKPPSASRFRRRVRDSWEERLEKRLAEEATIAEATLIVRRLARDTGSRKAADEERERPRFAGELGDQELELG